MVQFIRGSADPRDAALGQLSSALGQGLGKGLNTYYANKAIDEVLDNPELKDAPLSERWQEMNKAIGMYGENGQNILKQRLMTEKQANEEQEQKVLSRIVSGEKVSSKEIEKLSPKTQMDVLRYKQKQDEATKKITTETLSNESFSKGYKAILDKDTDTLKEVIADPNTPLNVKTQLSSIQNQFSNRTDVTNRDTSRRLNNIQESYRKAITEQRNRLGKHGGLRKADVDVINQKISQLESARDKDMQTFLNNPNDYVKLSIWGNPEMADFISKDEKPSEENKEESKGKKIKLPEDERKEAAIMLLKKHNGDQEAAMKEFDALYE